MKIAFFTLFALLWSSTALQAQNLFPETFDNCHISRFSLESDSTTAVINPQTFMLEFWTSIDSASARSIRGELKIQLLVDTLGNSCVISIENETNTDSKLLNLNRFASNLKWSFPEEVKSVSPIVYLRFNSLGARYSRLGASGPKGMHELVDLGIVESD